MKKAVRFGFALGLVLCLTGCESGANQAPVIVSIDGTGAVSARDSAVYTCQAYDPDGGKLSYAWSSSSGSIVRESANFAVWLAPASSETASVFVVVEDDSGASVTDTVRVRVLRDTATFIPYWDGAVKAGMYVSWYDSAFAGDTVRGATGTPADTFGDVYLMALDEVNFTRWVEQGTPEVILRRIAYTRGDTFWFAVNATGRYRIVIDNTQGEADYNYWIRAIRIGP